MTDDQLFDIPATKPKMAPAKFVEGPLAGKHYNVPEHGPAWIRYYDPAVDPENVHFYCHKRNTKRTYAYAGSFPYRA